jgi:DNA-binding response OmpR family regulator
VDDEPDVANLVGMGIVYQRPEYEIVESHSGTDALERAARERFDLVILDLMLPRMDGLAVCRAIRRESDVPVIMLTARDTELDTVVGLEVGADDYLTKPFSMVELIARIRAMLRRAAPRHGAPPERVELRGLAIDVARRRVTVEGTEVDLKPREFDLLAHLAGSPGRVFTREQLLASVWGLDYAGDPRTVDTHVKTLRERLSDEAERPRWIETVRGVGYRFREEAN